MSMKKTILCLVLLCCCVAVLSVNVFADNYGGEDDFGNLGGDTSEDTTALDEQTTEPAGSETTAESETSEPDGSVTEDATTEPGESNSEVTTPEESATEDATTEQDASGTETTAPDESERETTEPAEQPSETETQTEAPVGGLPMPLIIAGLAVVGVACLALVAVLMVMYFRSQKKS